MGLSPERALSALKQEAQKQAQEVAAGHSPSASPPGRTPASSPPSPSGGRSRSASGRSSGHAEDPDFHLPRDDPQVWRFEVVDVRLAPALIEGGESGWLAYGTLLSEGEQPPLATRPWRPRK